LRPRLGLLAAVAAALVGAASNATERGRDPFAFRAVLDGRPRMLVLALRPDLWVAYDAERAALYKVWEGGVEFRGAVYDWTHGPQPESRGRAWLVSPWQEPWQIVVDGTPRAARVRYRGHRLDAGRASLLYDVGLDGGPWVRVQESPEAVDGPDGARGLTRSFVRSGALGGVGLRLHLRLGHLRSEDAFETDGRLEPGSGGDAVLTLRGAGATELTTWLGEPREPTPDGPIASDVPAGEALVAASDCAVCHSPDRRTVGPAWLEIAGRYEDTEATVARLARRVLSGGSGVWGDAPMTPHPALSAEDAETMVAWILAQADPKPEALPAWRRIPLWLLGPIVRVIGWAQGASGPHDIDVERLVSGVHPSFDLETVRPPDWEPRVGGLGVLPDGRIAVATWDAEGGVHVVDGDRNVERIAAGLLEPLGLTVVDGDIYVLQKHELTRLVDEDGDDRIDRYETVSDQWRCSANFHEFAFGLVHDGEAFWANLATAVEPGGASSRVQAPGRGAVVRIDPRDGSVETVAFGLREPNGIGLGPGGRIFVTDNQGDWLPASKVLHVAPGAFYGSRAVGFPDTEALAVTPPVVWLPHSEVGNSPSQPVGIDVGPWQGQWIHGDVHYGGLQRVFVEEIDGVLQGAVFRFTQGLEAGVNRLAWGPGGALYVGGIGGPGDWGQPEKRWFGLQRLTWNGRPTFEMLAVRIREDGLAIELTEPIAPGVGPGPADFQVRDWSYHPTPEYGGPKRDLRELVVSAVTVAPGRREVFLRIGDLAAGRVVHLEVAEAVTDAAGHALWSREAWYTLNRLPR
jgi:cytochrome c